MRSSARFAAVCAILLAGAGSFLLGTCGPFTDVAPDAFCPFVLEIFYLGITTGTTPTTYDPAGNVTRLQMAAFLSRTVDATLRRGSRRAALGQFWTAISPPLVGVTTLGSTDAVALLASDGTDVWSGNNTGGTIARVRASDGKLLDEWTGAINAFDVLPASGYIIATGRSTPSGSLYRIDPGLPAGAVTTVATNLGANPQGLTFDGTRIWTANFDGSLSIVTPGSLPWMVTTVSGFSGPKGMIFDGSNVWMTEGNANTLLKLDATGIVLQTVTVDPGPVYPVFDGANVWVPTSSGPTVAVVRASTGAILANLTGNGLTGPVAAAFDGQRIAITNSGSSRVCFWKAADLAPLGFFTAAASPLFGIASDGVLFWTGSGNHLFRF
ncbi:MAG TPA: S-layer homology domain-containing protein [Thermoanaerobaculia bacterium]|nr:S-layer homology domain-containing protein [Thermoanaerobaculia bacterium]